MDVLAFYNNLGSSNVEQLEAQIDVMEQVLASSYRETK